MIRYRLRLLGRLVAELEVEADGFEVHIGPSEVEPTALKWGDDAGG